MKTERRHDLQTNLLAAWLAKKLKQIRPYTSLIVGSALGVVLFALIWMFVVNYFGGGEDKAWQEVTQQTSSVHRELRQISVAKGIDNTRKELQEVNDRLSKEKDPQKRQEIQQERQELIRQAAAAEVGAEILSNLRRVARDNPKTPAGWRAAMHLARTALAEGSDLMYRDPLRARDRLLEAITWYKSVKEHADDPLLRQAAQFGLARAYETSNERDEQNAARDQVKLAIAEYEELKANSVTYQEDAEQRLAALRSNENPFYLWFDRTIAQDVEDKTNPRKKPAKTFGSGASKAGTK